jgi:hypothetical protein
VEKRFYTIEKPQQFAYLASVEGAHPTVLRFPKSVLAKSGHYFYFRF